MLISLVIYSVMLIFLTISGWLIWCYLRPPSKSLDSLLDLSVTMTDNYFYVENYSSILTIENELGESMDYNIDDNDKYLNMFDVQQDISLKPDTFLYFKTPSETVQVLLEEFIVINIPTPNSMQVSILHAQKTCSIYINDVQRGV